MPARVLSSFLRTLWLLTYSDLTTFVLPQTLFGFFGALSGLALTTNATPSLIEITSRLPRIILWTWLNTLIFNLANKRHETSVLEDRINKPWRPVAAGRLSTTQARHLLISGIAIVLLITRFLGGFQETALLFILNWVYNDLGASDENILVRNATIAIAYMLYGLGALKVACGVSDCTSTSRAYTWLCMIGCVIFSTMHVQDLKDVDGDGARNRKTFPLVMGQETSRWSIAVSVLWWSTICPWFWNVPRLVHGVVMGLGIVIARRVIVLRNFEGDRMTWKLWAYWLITCYILPSVNLVS
jgi:4-hydroxybenzoate polyprenyltransferase